MVTASPSTCRAYKYLQAPLLSARKIRDMKKADVKRAKRIVAANRALFVEKWEEIHGNSGG